MENNKSVPQKNLYKALVDAYESDKDILASYGDTVTLKIHRDDEDEDEEPSAGSDRGPREEELEKNLSQLVHQRRRLPSQLASLKKGPNLMKSLLANQPVDKTAQHPDWFQKPTKSLTPDRDWNKTLPAKHGPVQPWISTLAWNEDPRESFNELMYTPLDFSAFVMKRFKVYTLTSELLAGPTYELIKVTKTKDADYGHIKWIEDFVPNSMESARDVYFKRRILAVTKLKIVERDNYKHLDLITVCRNDDKLYTFKEGNYNRLRL
ncbi:hypothetical protein Tco_1551509 [Tanacetum coccineum]